MTEKRTYVTRAEAEADVSFAADPLGSIGAILFSLSFVALFLLLGIALAGCGDETEDWEGSKYSAEMDCGYEEGELEHTGYINQGGPEWGDKWVFTAPGGEQITVSVEQGHVDCEYRSAR